MDDGGGNGVASHVAVSHVRVRVRVRDAATWETATWTVTGN